MTPQPNPNTPLVYRVGRRTEKQRLAVEAWADSATGSYWENDNHGVSVHWTKFDDLDGGWYVMNDAAYYVLQYVHDEECETRDLPELLDWHYEEIGQTTTAAANPVPFTPPWEVAPLRPLIDAMRRLDGPEE